MNNLEKFLFKEEVESFANERAKEIHGVKALIGGNEQSSNCIIIASPAWTKGSFSFLEDYFLRKSRYEKLFDVAIVFVTDPDDLCYQNSDCTQFSKYVENQFERVIGAFGTSSGATFLIDMAYEIEIQTLVIFNPIIDHEMSIREGGKGQKVKLDQLDYLRIASDFQWQVNTGKLLYISTKTKMDEMNLRSFRENIEVSYIIAEVDSGEHNYSLSPRLSVVLSFIDKSLFEYMKNLCGNYSYHIESESHR